jgi:hypothetical protein
LWSRKIDFGPDLGFVTIFVPIGPYAKGAIKLYDENGTLLSYEKPFGGFTKKGFNVSITVDPNTDMALIAIAKKSSGTKVAVYEITTTKLHSVGLLTVTKTKGNIVPAFLKMYSDAAGLATMVNGKKTTLKTWRYDTSGLFVNDPLFVLSQLKIRGNTILLK